MVSFCTFGQEGGLIDELQPKQISDIKQFIEIARRNDAKGKQISDIRQVDR